MKMTRWVAGLLLTVVLSGCAVGNKGVSKTLTKKVVTSRSVVGTYYAKLPYKNDKLVIDLLLEKTHTYSMLNYVESTGKESYENGMWQQQGNKIILTPALSQSGAKTKGLLIRENNQLQLLDAKGQPYQKAAYAFKKK